MSEIIEGHQAVLLFEGIESVNEDGDVEQSISFLSSQPFSV